MKYATVVLAALLMSTTSGFQVVQKPVAELPQKVLAQSKNESANASSNAARNVTITGEVPPTLPNPAVPAQKEMQNGELGALTKHDPPTSQPGYLRQAAKDRKQTAVDPQGKKK